MSHPMLLAGGLFLLVLIGLGAVMLDQMFA
jgi:hypothetical protein